MEKDRFQWLSERETSLGMTTILVLNPKGEPPCTRRGGAHELNRVRGVEAKGTYLIIRE